MCRGFPKAVQNVAVQRHVGSDSCPLGSTLVQLLLAIASTYSCATARPYPRTRSAFTFEWLCALPRLLVMELPPFKTPPPPPPPAPPRLAFASRPSSTPGCFLLWLSCFSFLL